LKSYCKIVPLISKGVAQEPISASERLHMTLR